MKNIFIIFFFFGLTNLYSQITLLKDYPFQAGEEVVYDAIYELGFIEVRAGTVSFHVDSVVENNISFYH
ncbi:MAG: hypothetical protein GQ527_06605, partial [Bacteroidales bacterium]|nr:hypothetical protein [Bacteroidales bacterium]